MLHLNVLVGLLLCFQAIAQGNLRLPAATLHTVIPEPQDRPFHGVIRLLVDARDTQHAIFSVTEEIPVVVAGDFVLFYPEWDTGSHAPTESAVELAGLQAQIDGHAVDWRRDVLNVHAFHIKVPAHARTLLISFQYLSTAREAILRPQMIEIPWSRLVLYPAGWYERDVFVAPRIELPEGLQIFTSLTITNHATPAAGEISFEPERLDRLIDSPVYAAKYGRRMELAAPAQQPVHVDILADAPGDLMISSADSDKLQELINQTERVFGEPPFAHYDAVISLSDELSPGGGIEHLEEGENHLPANYFSAGDRQLPNRDLIAHEYVHAWNGCFRQPAGLWSPNSNRPVDPSLLWVYEGQTEFWGRVLAARAKVRSVQESLDMLALDASHVANRSGREWKTLADSTLDVVYMPGKAVTWRDWQRREDYYPEGVLLWLDVDAHLRELTHERRGLDDFARAFFATHGLVRTISTYTFQDVCAALNAIARADWAGFLNHHLETHSDTDAVAGLARAGWKLVYSSEASDTFLQDEAASGGINLDTSLGLQLSSSGSVRSVMWNGPAFRAGLAPAMQIVAIDGKAFSRKAVLEATNNAGSVPVRVTIEQSNQSRDVLIPYSGSLRYPHLERIVGTADRLTPLLTPR